MFSAIRKMLATYPGLTYKRGEEKNNWYVVAEDI